MATWKKIWKKKPDNDIPVAKQVQKGEKAVEKAVAKRREAWARNWVKGRNLLALPPKLDHQHSYRLDAVATGGTFYYKK